MRALICGVLICLVLSGRAAAWSTPDASAAWASLVETPLRVTGNVVGGAGLVAAPAVALVGDAVALVDATWVPPGPLDGWVSGPVRRLAMTISWTGTSASWAAAGRLHNRAANASRAVVDRRRRLIA